MIYGYNKTNEVGAGIIVLDAGTLGDGSGAEILID